MEITMDQLAKTFKALSDESRLRILGILLNSDELCVCDIETVMGFTQTKVSRHLAYLKQAGFVEDRRQGQWMLYRIAKPKAEEQKKLLACVEGLLKADPAAQKDARLLAKNIQKGSCTTFAALNSRVVPAAIELQRP